MGIVSWWRVYRMRRQLTSCGVGCAFHCRRMEVKGPVSAGNNCVFYDNLVLRCHKEGEIILGDGVMLDHYVLIQCNARVEIGAGAYIGPYCVLRDTNHLFHGTDVHWRLTPHLTKPIVIGEESYIGPRCYIMPGVSIGKGAVIGPSSVVTRDVPDLEIWAGSPARLIAHRTDAARRARLKRDLNMASFFGRVMDEDTGEPTGSAAEKADE